MTGIIMNDTGRSRERKRRGGLKLLGGRGARTRGRALGSAILFGVTLTLMAPSPSAADWPTYGHDLANSRSAGGQGPSMSQIGSLHPAWTFNSSNGDFP